MTAPVAGAGRKRERPSRRLAGRGTLGMVEAPALHAVRERVPSAAATPADPNDTRTITERHHHPAGESR